MTPGLLSESESQDPLYMYATNQGKSPVWNLGQVFENGAYDLVTLPLMYKVRNVQVPENLNCLEKENYIRSVKSEMVIYKVNNSPVKCRIITFLPDVNYARNRSYDISHNTITRMDTAYSGMIVVKDSDEKIIRIWQIQHGKIIKKMKPVVVTGVNAAGENSIGTESTHCVFQPVADNFRVVCFGTMVGDVLVIDHCNDPEPTGTEYDFVCEEVDDDTPLPCDDISTPEDECLGGIFGDDPPGDGGGGGDNPPTEPDPCSQAQSFVSNINVFSQNPTYSTAKNNVLASGATDQKEHGVTFGKNSNGEITVSPLSTGNSYNAPVNTNWQGAFADLHNHPDNLPPSSADMYGLISININKSDYSTRMVVTVDGTVYALVVIDPTKATSFVNQYPKQQIANYPPDFPDPIFTDFTDIKFDLVTKGLSAKVADEMALAFVLDKYNSGVALLKQDANGNFHRLKTEQTSSNGASNYIASNCL